MATSSAAQAVVLWDQSTINPAGIGVLANHATGFNGFNAHSVNDVTVPASGWVVTKITQWYAGFDPNWISGITSGYLDVFPKTGPLPLATDVPSAVQVAGWSCVQDPVRTAQLGQSVLEVSLTVNLNLPPGNYWIGICPRRSNSPFGANSMWASSAVGDPVATQLVPGPWTSSAGGWDGTFRIEGEVPVPSESKSWGSMKALYR
jgi:hypothetical protein